MSGEWSFRGQADSRWELTPSLLRKVPAGFSPQEFERNLLNDLRSVLHLKTTLPERLVENEDFLLAFAQHYRVPTRLTDWTRDPLVALYFAASDAMREVVLAGSQEGKLSVLALANIYLSIGGAKRKSAFVHPPAGGNANLTAQRAHLLKHEWKAPNLLNGLAPRPTEDPVKNVTALLASRFIRLDLGWNYAWTVVELLQRVGLTADLVYPSEEGLVRRAADLALGSDVLRLTGGPGSTQANAGRADGRRRSG
jgi:hypothetical protein